MNDQTPVLQVKGIGEKTQRLFQKLDIETVGDLIRHYPRDYEVFEDPVMISAAAPGAVCLCGGHSEPEKGEKPFHPERRHQGRFRRDDAYFL